MKELFIHEDLKENLFNHVEGAIPCYQYLFKFENGYGASVIQFDYSCRWELAVIYFYDEDEWHLCYDTPITDDVIDGLTDEEVNDILRLIKALDKLPNDYKEIIEEDEE